MNAIFRFMEGLPGSSETQQNFVDDFTKNKRLSLLRAANSLFWTGEMDLYLIYVTFTV